MPLAGTRRWIKTLKLGVKEGWRPWYTQSGTDWAADSSCKAGRVCQPADILAAQAWRWIGVVHCRCPVRHIVVDVGPGASAACARVLQARWAAAWSLTMA